MSKILLRGVVLILLLALIVALGIYVFVNPLQYLPRPKITDHVVRETVLTQLLDDRQDGFLVTGVLELYADITKEDTKYFFPEYFDETFSLGTTRSRVRLPGSVSYGLDLSSLDSSHINILADSIVVFTVGAIDIHSVEVDLERMQVQTEVGWARLQSRSGKQVERRAMIEAQNTIRGEAQRYLSSNPQPLINTERVLESLLVDVLKRTGIANPVIKCQIAPAIVDPVR